MELDKRSIDELESRISQLEHVVGMLLVVLLDGEPALDFDYRAFAEEHGWNPKG